MEITAQNKAEIRKIKDIVISDGKVAQVKTIELNGRAGGWKIKREGDSVTFEPWGVAAEAEFKNDDISPSELAGWLLQTAGYEGRTVELKAVLG